jgi:hypothetical protein
MRVAVSEEAISGQPEKKRRRYPSLRLKAVGDRCAKSL